ncbi:MAG: DUF234 domain-containing protein, partial [Sulfurimonas sp.]|nr:DUF234 domain-containing protein [Sulfurimonas sp.]
YKSAVEIENYEYVKDIVNRDYTTYSGRFLEKYFIEKLKLSNQYSSIGTYWERGNENEIDIVGVNDDAKTMLIAEVKRQAKKIDIHRLQEKAQKLVTKYKNYRVDYVGYSLSDM